MNESKSHPPNGRLSGWYIFSFFLSAPDLLKLRERVFSIEFDAPIFYKARNSDAFNTP
jgi:hypothetical protein